MIVKSYSRSFAVILGLLGITLVGGGGALTTYAWNEFDRADSKKAIIISVAKEWTFNQNLYGTNPLLMGDSASLRGYEFYPRFSDPAIRSALMSSLFDMTDSLDNKLLAVLWKMNRVIYDTNNRLQVTDNYSLNNLDRESVAERRRIVIESGRLKWFVNNQETLGEFIKSSYPWALTDSVEIAPAQE